MSLPKSQPSNAFLRKKNIESIVLPLVILGTLLGILFIGVILPKQQKETKKQEKSKIESLTETTVIKNSSGETITVPPQVLQKSPDEVKDALDNNEKIIIVQLINRDGYNVPHIKGSIFVPESANPTSTYNLNPQDKHVFVSQDGVASAILIDKFIGLGLPNDKNFNLKGGLTAWKEKGFELER